MQLTLERLKELFYYDPETGFLMRRVARGNSCAGARVTTIGAGGRYRIVAIDKKRYKVSRVAWFYMTGAWPPAQIDHKDRDTLNDAWSNLRSATHSQNMMNRPFSRMRFVDDGWDVRIQTDGVRRYLGRFRTRAEAVRVYRTAARRYHGEFAVL